jgi:hypothetical protein
LAGMCALALGHPSMLCYDRGSGTAVVRRRGGPMGRRRGWAGRSRGGPQRPGEPPGRRHERSTQLSALITSALFPKPAAVIKDRHAVQPEASPDPLSGTGGSLAEWHHDAGLL